GDWSVSLFPLEDARGNSGSFGPPAAFDSTVLVVNRVASDVSAPQLVEFEVSPLVVDVSESAQVVSVRARVTDDASGALAPTMQLSSDTTDQQLGFGPMA